MNEVLVAEYAAGVLEGVTSAERICVGFVILVKSVTIGLEVLVRRLR